MHVTADVAFLITFGFVSLRKAEQDLKLMAMEHPGGGAYCPAELSASDTSNGVPAVVFEDTGSKAGKMKGEWRIGPATASVQQRNQPKIL